MLGGGKKEGGREGRRGEKGWWKRGLSAGDNDDFAKFSKRELGYCGRTREWGGEDKGEESVQKS